MTERGISVMEHAYPEMLAGGYPLNHPRVTFFVRVRSLLPPNAKVLNFGAGRGKFKETDFPGVRVHTDLRPYVARLAAFDVDKAVLENIETDDRHYAAVGERLPFPDESFDLVYCTWVVEHITDPAFYAAEIGRILKPGGWFCALTPNKWSIIALGARLTPARLHWRVLSFLALQRKEQDTFPTVYRLNTRADVRRHFHGWTDASHYMSGPGAYHGGKLWLLRLWQVVDWLLPKSMSKLLLIYVRRPGPA